jgi:hydroxyacylglutathione hydrolase
MIKIHGIPAFSDNYIWCIYDEKSREALLVDPGSYEAAESFLQENQLSLTTILITHHHPDHCGGVERLTRLHPATVYGSANCRHNFIDRRVNDGDIVEAMGLEFSVIDVPGHTLDHNAYFCASTSLSVPALFCGDTLFSGGCGRLFEGSANQMFCSLEKLASLPSETHVYCAHEYTLSNLEFAKSLMPANEQLASYTQHCHSLRQNNQSTIPSTIGTELNINPFLRSSDKEIFHSLKSHNPGLEGTELAVFTACRQAKDNF